jgi:nucleoside 2-deoxyribosyltransferase
MKGNQVVVQERIREVFVGGPFFGVVNPWTGAMNDDEQRKITCLLEFFEVAGAKVYNSHRREAWGKEFLTADVVTRLDFEEIRSSDIFVAYPGAPASPGTHVEIGWASALGKPMVLLLDETKKYSFLVTGLPTIANVEFVTYRDLDHLLEQLPGAVATVMRRSRASAARAV